MCEQKTCLFDLFGALRSAQKKLYTFGGCANASAFIDLRSESQRPDFLVHPTANNDLRQGDAPLPSSNDDLYVLSVLSAYIL